MNIRKMYRLSFNKIKQYIYYGYNNINLELHNINIPHNLCVTQLLNNGRKTVIPINGSNNSSSFYNLKSLLQEKGIDTENIYTPFSFNENNQNVTTKSSPTPLVTLYTTPLKLSESINENKYFKQLIFNKNKIELDNKTIRDGVSAGLNESCRVVIMKGNDNTDKFELLYTIKRLHENDLCNIVLHHNVLDINNNPTVIKILSYLSAHIDISSIQYNIKYGFYSHDNRLMLLNEFGINRYCITPVNNMDDFSISVQCNVEIERFMRIYMIHINHIFNNNNDYF